MNEVMDPPAELVNQPGCQKQNIDENYRQKSKDEISQKNTFKRPRQEKDLSDVNSSLLDGEANHKLTVESVPALCKRFHFIREIIQ
jgi:hypothetical protein